MNGLTHNKIIRNKSGRVRSGWIILIVMGIFEALSYGYGMLVIKILRSWCIATGNLDDTTGYASPLVDWLNDDFLPIFFQISMEIIMIAVPVMAWRLMRHSMAEMGLAPPKRGGRELWVGMIFGIVNISVVFGLVLLEGNARIVSLTPVFSGQAAWWIFTFIMVGFAEEIMNRGFFMSTLRRTNNMYLIVLAPSVIFGCIHLSNPNVTVISMLNIILVGVLFSYMYIKSGNIWMCIGYHITWNIFQGVIYGMPVSGLNIKGFITTEFLQDNLFNGGGFGVEGGVLTTAVTLLGFLFVRHYYRDSTWDFCGRRESLGAGKGDEA